MPRLLLLNGSPVLVPALALAALIGFGAPPSAQAQDQLYDPFSLPSLGDVKSEFGSGNTGKWSVEVGAGVGVAPAFSGSNEASFVALPVIDVSWDDRVYLSLREGFGVHVIKGRPVQAGVAVKPDFGRSEDADDILRGMGDIDPSAVVRAYVDGFIGPVTIGAGIEQGLGPGHTGLTGDLSALFTQPVGERSVFILGPTLEFADSEFMQTFYGVGAGQAGRSVHPQFTAEGGLHKADFSVVFSTGFGENWRFGAIGSVGQLLGDAADSPITDSDTTYFVGTTISYKLY